MQDFSISIPPQDAGLPERSLVSINHIGIGAAVAPAPEDARASLVNGQSCMPRLEYPDRLDNTLHAPAVVGCIHASGMLSKLKLGASL